VPFGQGLEGAVTKNLKVAVVDFGTDVRFDCRDVRMMST
jgi:hypothetical protein